MEMSTSSDSSTGEDFLSKCESLPSSTSSSSDKSPKRRLHRILNFVEVTVENYDDEEFRQHFRLNRYTCQIVLGIKSENISFINLLDEVYQLFRSS